MDARSRSLKQEERRREGSDALVSEAGEDMIAVMMAPCVVSLGVSAS